MTCRRRGISFDRREFGMVNDSGKVRLKIQVEALKGDSIPMPPTNA